MLWLGKQPVAAGTHDSCLYFLTFIKSLKAPHPRGGIMSVMDTECCSEHADWQFLIQPGESLQFKVIFPSGYCHISAIQTYLLGAAFSFTQPLDERVLVFLVLCPSTSPAQPWVLTHYTVFKLSSAEMGKICLVKFGIYLNIDWCWWSASWLILNFGTELNFKKKFKLKKIYIIKT